MKRRNFFKSFIALIGVVAVAPLELFGERKDFGVAIDPHDYGSIGYLPAIKKYGHVDFSKPSGKLWDWDEINQQAYNGNKNFRYIRDEYSLWAHEEPFEKWKRIWDESNINP